MRIRNLLLSILVILFLASCSITRKVDKQKVEKVTESETERVIEETIQRKGKETVTIDEAIKDIEADLEVDDDGNIQLRDYEVITDMQGIDIKVSITDNKLSVTGIFEERKVDVLVDENVTRLTTEKGSKTTKDTIETKEKESETGWTGLYTVIGIVLVVIVIAVFLYIKGIKLW